MAVLLRQFQVAAAALLLIAGCQRPTDSTARTSFASAPVIVISIDTLRADHLPAWGYEGVKTPNIDSLRADGVMFRNAYSQVPLTLPSHASIFTGLLPAAHGVRDNIGYRLTGGRATLPQTLKQNGYATGAAVSAYVLRGNTGIGELFDWYDDGIAFTPGADLGSVQRPGASTVAAATSWIGKQGSSPFFFFLHLFEPHTPYEPPEPYRSAATLPYDGEIAHVDSILGTFIEELRRTGIYDRAVIVLLSDHGEGLGDHGEKEHGIFVYREAIHVPLIVKLPKNTSAGSVVDAPVGLIDVFPTVLSLLGVKQPAVDGAPLLGRDAKDVPDRRIFSESLYARLHFGWSDVRSLISDQYHYIDAPRAELYSVAEDVREERNLLAEERRVAASFRNQIAQFDKRMTAPSAASREEAAKLAALGYISAPAADAGANLPDAKDHVHQLAEYEVANAAFARGDAQSAIDAFKRLLAANPHFTDAALGLARAYDAARQPLAAAEVYRGLLARNPALTEQAAVGVATAFMNAGRLDDARAHAELVLPSNPPAAHLLLGRIAMAARAPRDAQRHAREAAANQQYAAEGVLLLSEALLAESPQKAPEALRLLDALKSERAARGAPPVRSLEIARASALMRLSRVPDAIEALRTEIRFEPQRADAYGRLAAIHLTQNDVGAAEAVLAQMVAVSPAPANYALAANTLAHFGHDGAATRWRQRAEQGGSR
ncbi:MAG TPA: sulfatase-like hydrolase/transferase [Thermoanaerobaculia bacterium]|nr:sulfatase-like hydrolase/transferase [Thermoanaerobaculia bacterium]